MRALALGLSVSLLLPAGAYAAAYTPSEPADAGKSQAELAGYSEERWAELNDNTLNYEELRDLVHTFNPAISTAWNSFDSAIADMNTMKENLQSREREMTGLRDAAKSGGDMASYGNYAMQAAILKNVSHSISVAKDKLARPVNGSNRMLREAEAQVVAGAQSLMTAWAGMEDRRQVLSELVQMDQALYDNAVSRAGAGTGTQTDVLSAQAGLLTAQVQLSQVETAQDKLKKSLIVMCGWNENADPEIGAVPAADPSRLDSMNPDADLTQAIGNNFSLISFRNEDHKKSTASHNARNLTEDEMDQNIAQNLQAYYNEALSDRTGLEAAQAGYEAAQITKNAADTQYRLGMITAAQLDGANVSYITAKTNLSTADRTLLEAIRTYDNAVAGMCPTE